MGDRPVADKSQLLVATQSLDAPRSVRPLAGTIASAVAGLMFRGRVVFNNLDRHRFKHDKKHASPLQALGFAMAAREQRGKGLLIEDWKK